MSTQTRPPQDLGPVLRYAPPRVREQAQADEPSVVPPEDWPEGLDGETIPEFISKDRGIVHTQRRLTLQPEWLPEPPASRDDGDLWTTMIRAGSLLGVAVLVAWLVVSKPFVRLLLDSQLLGARFAGTAIANNAATPPPPPRTQDRLVLIEHARSMQRQSASAEPFIQSPESIQNAPAKPVQLAMASAAPSGAMEAGARPVSTSTNVPAPVTPAAPDFVTRQLDRAEVTSLLQRADDVIKSGDLSSARLLLERAAEGGDARAALTLAGTFDPHVLQALGLQDGAPDIAKARLWYERAAKLGSADAPLRLQQLATASAQ
jgi:hypothetical protein